MPSATAHEETIAGVPGVRFRTDARQHTSEEERLQEIQSRLSGGEDDLPSQTTLPHLALEEVQTVDGPSYSVISLWVPTDKRAEAAERLRAAGFTVSG